MIRVAVGRGELSPNQNEEEFVNSSYLMDLHDNLGSWNF